MGELKITANQETIITFHEQCRALNQILLCRRETTEFTVGYSIKTSVQFSVFIIKVNRITGIIRKGTKEKTTQNHNVPLFKFLVHLYALASVKYCRITKKDFGPGPQCSWNVKIACLQGMNNQPDVLQIRQNYIRYIEVYFRMIIHCLS